MAHTGIKHFWTCTTDPGTSLCQSFGCNRIHLFDQNCFRVLHLLKVLCEKNKTATDAEVEMSPRTGLWSLKKTGMVVEMKEKEKKAEIERAHDEDENREST